MKNSQILKKAMTMAAVFFITVMGTSTVFAQYQHPATVPVGDSAQMHQELLKHDPEMKYDDEVPVEKINTEVSDAIKEAYAGYEISKVYRARDGSYKVKMKKDNEKVTAYYSVNGELLRTESGEDKKEK